LYYHQQRKEKVQENCEEDEEGGAKQLEVQWRRRSDGSRASHGWTR
jgi:hypothetical protein